MLEYRVMAHRPDAFGSVARAKDTTLTLETSLAGRPDAFNPAEVLLASVAACKIKGIEWVTPVTKFDCRGVEVTLHAVRQDSPPKLISIDYELISDTDERDERLDLLHKNVRKYGTISNTVSRGVPLEGHIRRKT